MNKNAASTGLPMFNCTVKYGDEDLVEVRSQEQLDAVLNAWHEKALEGKPTLVEIIVPSGAVLSVGLGSNQSVLSYVSASKDPPYYVSVGNIDLSGTAVFYFYGHWTEFFERNLISQDQARNASKYFVLSDGGLSPDIIWEEI